MSKAFSAKIKGDREVLRRLAAIERRIPRAIDNALHEEALGLEAESAPITPVADVDGGNLRRSSQVKQIRQGYSVGYYTDYAIYVHEMTDPGVNWSTPGTGPKYLQKPFEKRLRTMRGRMRRVIKHYLGI